MAEYLMLIFAPEDEAGASDAEVSAEHSAFMQRNGSSLRGGARLRPTHSATSIRRDTAGAVTVTDGPFYETKEVLGGYYLIEAEDIDSAIAIAKQIPTRGGVEVRPIWLAGEE